MKAFLTLWNEDEDLRVTKTVDCDKLTVYDGAKISINGEQCQLFNVLCYGASDIIPHVVTIEIL